MAEWISMSDETPAFGEPVIYYDARMDEVLIGDWRQDGHFWRTGGERIPSEFVTHWQRITRPTLTETERDRIARLDVWKGEGGA